MTTEKKSTFVKPFLWWGLGVVVLIGLYWLGIRLIYKSACFEPWLEPNEFGDMFGFLSCLFSGLAFAGLIVTIRQQRDDLELQRQELKRANDEAEAQTQQFEEQLELAKQAQFRDDFYRRYELLQKNKDAIMFLNPGADIKNVTTGERGCWELQERTIENISKISKGILKGSSITNQINFEKIAYQGILVWFYNFCSIANDTINFWAERPIQGCRKENQFLTILYNSLTPCDRFFIVLIRETLQNPEIDTTLKHFETLGMPIRETSLQSCSPNIISQFTSELKKLFTQQTQ